MHKALCIQSTRLPFDGTTLQQRYQRYAELHSLPYFSPSIENDCSIYSIRQCCHRVVRNSKRESTCLLVLFTFNAIFLLFVKILQISKQLRMRKRKLQFFTKAAGPGNWEAGNFLCCILVATLLFQEFRKKEDI